MDVHGDPFSKRADLKIGPTTGGSHSWYRPPVAFGLRPFRFWFKTFYQGYLVVVSDPKFEYSLSRNNDCFCCLTSHLLWMSDYIFRYKMWTHLPGSHRRKARHTGVFFLRLPSAVLALIFYREKDSAVAFPRRA